MYAHCYKKYMTSNITRLYKYIDRIKLFQRSIIRYFALALRHCKNFIYTMKLIQKAVTIVKQLLQTSTVQKYVIHVLSC